MTTLIEKLSFSIGKNEKLKIKDLLSKNKKNFLKKKSIFDKSYTSTQKVRAYILGSCYIDEIENAQEISLTLSEICDHEISGLLSSQLGKYPQAEESLIKAHERSQIKQQSQIALAVSLIAQKYSPKTILQVLEPFKNNLDYAKELLGVSYLMNLENEEEEIKNLNNARLWLNQTKSEQGQIINTEVKKRIDLITICEQGLKREPFTFDFTPKKIKNIYSVVSTIYGQNNPLN